MKNRRHANSIEIMKNHGGGFITKYMNLNLNLNLFKFVGQIPLPKYKNRVLYDELMILPR